MRGAREAERSSNVALGLGIAAFLLSWVPLVGLGLLIAAIVTGHRAHGRCREAGVAPGKAIAGFALGYAAILGMLVFGTVFLASVVFVLVSDLGDSGDDAPAVSMTPGPGDGELQVTAIRNGPVHWSEVDVDGCSQVPSDAMREGDVLSGCQGQVTLRHTPSDSVLYRGTV